MECHFEVDRDQTDRNTCRHRVSDEYVPVDAIGSKVAGDVCVEVSCKIFAEVCVLCSSLRRMLLPERVTLTVADLLRSVVVSDVYQYQILSG